MGSKRDRNPPREKVVDDDGHKYRLQAMGGDYEPQQRSLPPKKGLEHRIIVNVSYKMTWQGALDAYNGVGQFHLDMENQVMFTMGCWDCELPFEEIKDNPICMAMESPS